MLNWIWLGMMIVSVLVAGLSGELEALSTGLIESSQNAVMKLALPLGGLMCFMLGLMKLVEQSGLIVSLARFARPVLRRLFPDVPAEHPAMGSMLLNLTANFLGAGNAATPLGLRAMAQLETLNPQPGTATNAQCLFLALNTGALTLISTTALSIMKEGGSSDPTAIIGTSVLAAACAAVAGVLAAKTFEKLPFFRVRAESGAGLSPEVVKPKADEPTYVPVEPRAPTLQSSLIMAGAILFLVGLYLYQVFTAPSGLNVFQRFIGPVSQLAMPSFVLLVLVYAALARLAVFEVFIEGAKEGMNTALRIIPFLVAMLTAIGALRASGVIMRLTSGFRWVLEAVGCEPETWSIAALVPMALMRPLSGSGSSAVLRDLIGTHGADSFIGRAAATMYGSTETTFYVLAVYFGSVGIKRARHGLACGLSADLAGMTASVVICWLMFR
jgi:spore maturation protein SpmA/spore maturation protein SpmB